MARDAEDEATFRVKTGIAASDLAGCLVLDVRLPGMLYGKILRSPHASAVVQAIDLSVARRMPGVKATLINGYAAEPNNIRSGAYVLSRPLVLVSVAHPPDEVNRFLQFMLSPEGQAIVARKFVPIR